MKDSYLLVGVRLGVLLRLIRRNRVSILPKYIFRLLFLLMNACWASIFALAEKRRFHKAYNAIQVPDNPVIIVGHWRTGSTLLHQLMNLDNGFCSPSLFQTTLPDSFLFSSKYYKPVMSRIMPKHRPMDNVKSGFDEPQEDEYATFRLCGESPLERLIFPKKTTYFLDEYGKEKGSEANIIAAWSNSFSLFCRKLYFHTPKTLLLKNPFLSLRIPEIISLYPNARFIHIKRNPLKVIPSTIHMWDTVGRQNSLNGNHLKPEIKEVTTYYRQMIQTIEKSFAELRENNYIEITYEDLVKDPSNVIRSVYGHLDIPFTTEYENKLSSYLQEEKGYQSNSHQLSAEEKKLIEEAFSG